MHVCPSKPEKTPVSGGFPRRLRLLKPSDYQRLFAHSARQLTPHLSALYRSNGLTHARLGLAVPKRQMQKAVARNRFKRLVRESFRRHQHELAGLDIVIVARTGAQHATNRDLSDNLHRLWRQLSTSCAPS